MGNETSLRKNRPVGTTYDTMLLCYTPTSMRGNLERLIIYPIKNYFNERNSDEL